MASTEYDFILDRDELIDESFKKIGALADGQNISAEQLDTANKKLNLIIKSWEATGAHLWTYVTDSVATVASTASYLVPTTNGPHFVDRAYIVVNSTERRLERLSISQYADIYDKAAQGEPCAFYHNVAEAKVYFWPTPNAIWTVKLFGYRRLKDWESASSTGEFPARWQTALKYALAVELGEDYKIPLKETQYLRSIAVTEYNKARLREADPADCNFVRGAYD